MDPVIFRQTDDGRCLAIRNWRHRLRWDDAMVAEPLDAEQRARYLDHRAAGLSDVAIYRRLFPDIPGRAAHPPPADDLAELPAELLRGLLEDLLGRPLPSLARANRRDLAALLRHALIGRTAGGRRG